MSVVHVPTGDLAFAPTDKTWRLLLAQWPQVVTRVESPSAPFTYLGTPYPPGYLLVTSGTTSATVLGDIVAALIALADGTDDPPEVGVRVPCVPTPADLPPQPPTVPPGTLLLVATEAPVALYGWKDGAYTELSET